MKFNFTIDVDNTEYLQDEIIENVALKFIEQVLGDGWDEKDLYSKLERTVLNKMENIMDVNFKEEVAQKVTENLTKKFEKTKQYKALIHNEEVVPDNLIKSGLKSIISDLVKSEMKNIFSNR